MQYCAIADKETLASVVFTAVYRDPKSNFPYIKRIKIEGWIMNKAYHLVPEKAEMLFFTAEPNRKILVHYDGKSRLKAGFQQFNVKQFEVKGSKANGVKMLSREVVKVVAVQDDRLFADELLMAPEAAAVIQGTASRIDLDTKTVKPKTVKPKAAQPKAAQPKAAQLKAGGAKAKTTTRKVPTTQEDDTANAKKTENSTTSKRVTGNSAKPATTNKVSKKSSPSGHTAVKKPDSASSSSLLEKARRKKET